MKPTVLVTREQKEGLWVWAHVFVVEFVSARSVLAAFEDDAIGDLF
jgi:hypothetical protein